MKFIPYENIDELYSAAITEVFGEDKYTFKFGDDEEYMKNEKVKNTGYNGAWEALYYLEVFKKDKRIEKYEVYQNEYFNCCGIGNLNNYQANEYGLKLAHILPFVVMMRSHKGIYTLSMSMDQEAAIKIANRMTKHLGGNYLEVYNHNSGNDIRHYQINSEKLYVAMNFSFYTEKYYNKIGARYRDQYSEEIMQRNYDRMIEYKTQLVGILTAYKNANNK